MDGTEAPAFPGRGLVDASRRASHQLLQADRLSNAEAPCCRSPRKRFLRWNRHVAARPGFAAGRHAKKTPWLRPQLEAIAKTVAEASAVAEKNSQAAAKPLLTGFSLTRALIGKVES